MTSRQKLVIRILLLVARLIADEGWQKEISDLANHITYSNIAA